GAPHQHLRTVGNIDDGRGAPLANEQMDAGYGAFAAAFSANVRLRRDILAATPLRVLRRLVAVCRHGARIETYHLLKPCSRWSERRRWTQQGEGRARGNHDGYGGTLGRVKYSSTALPIESTPTAMAMSPPSSFARAVSTSFGEQFGAQCVRRSRISLVPFS